jgi:hypothetical protein
MKSDWETLKLSVLGAGLLTTLTLVPGCALLVVGGVAAGTAYGTVEYINNTLDVTQEVSLDKAWSAANAALKELQMPATTSKKDGASGKIQAHNAQGQPITIELIWQTNSSTEIKISVGTFDRTENRVKALQIYDQMKAHF